MPGPWKLVGVMFFFMHSLYGQTCLILSPPAIQADGTSKLELSLYSADTVRPVALQWTLETPSPVTTVNVDAGPALGATGKAAFCAGADGTYRCIAAGFNAGPIDDGIVAKIAVTAVSRTTPVHLVAPMAVSADGYWVPIVLRTKSILGAYLARDCRLQPPRRTEKER